MARSRITYYFDCTNKTLEPASYIKALKNISPFYHPDRYILIGRYQSNENAPYLSRGKIYRYFNNKNVCIRDLRAEGWI